MLDFTCEAYATVLSNSLLILNASLVALCLGDSMSTLRCDFFVCHCT